MKEIKKYSLVVLMMKLNLKYFRHITQREDSLEKAQENQRQYWRNEADRRKGGEIPDNAITSLQELKEFINRQSG